MSLHDDQPLTGYEQGALGRSLATPDAESWWAGLPPNTRKAIMQKLLAALAKAEAPRDIGTLTRSLMKADELDAKRDELKRNAPAQHLDAAAVMRDYIAHLKASVNGGIA